MLSQTNHHDPNQRSSLRVQLALPNDYNTQDFLLLAYQYLLGSALSYLTDTLPVEARYFQHQDKSINLAWRSSEWSLSISVVLSQSLSTPQLSINEQEIAIQLDKLTEHQKISTLVMQKNT